MIVLTATLSSWWLWAVSRVAARESAFINDEECLPGLSRLLGDNIKRLIKQRAHLSDLAGAADASAELEEHRFLAGLAGQPVARAFCCRCLSRAYVAGKNDEGISIGDGGAEGEFLVMKLLAPVGEFLGISKQAKSLWSLS